MTPSRARKGADERREKERNTDETRATSLIQSILRDPDKAASELENDLRSGGDVPATRGLLAAAESLASLRGLDIGTQIASVRQHLKRAGFVV